MTNPPNPESPDAGSTPPQQPESAQPEAPRYSPPQQPEPGQPPVPPSYPAPAVAPQQPQYGHPQQPPYGQPQQPAPQYAPPAQPYGQPGQAPYGQPAYAQPGQQPYGAPQYGAQPAYPAPVYGAPGPGGPFDGATDPEDLTRPLYGATFGQAIKRFFKQYADFNGRASRSEYWWVSLFVFLVQLVPIILLMVGLIGMGISTSSYSYDPYSYGYGSAAPAVGAIILLVIGAILTGLVSLALLIPSFAVGWRRFHDANFAGPLYLLSLAAAIPYIGWVGSVVVLVFSLMPSKVEGRRYDAPRA